MPKKRAADTEEQIGPSMAGVARMRAFKAAHGIRESSASCMGSRYLSTGNKRFAKGKLLEAILLFQKAEHWYAVNGYALDQSTARTRIIEAVERLRCQYPSETFQAEPGDLPPDPKLTPSTVAMHPAGIVNVERKSNKSGENSGATESSQRKTLPANPLADAEIRPLEIPKPILRLKDELKQPKTVIKDMFQRTLDEMVGWKGTPEENSKAVEAIVHEATETGRRFCYHKNDEWVPVSLSYCNRVFTLTRDTPEDNKKSGYVASSATWPELTTLPRKGHFHKRQRRTKDQITPVAAETSK